MQLKQQPSKTMKNDPYKIIIERFLDINVGIFVRTQNGKFIYHYENLKGYTNIPEAKQWQNIAYSDDFKLGFSNERFTHYVII